jgi:DNA-binding HxlR family transcriptional regulator
VAKSYCQHCPVAHALDVVGERWSLLIVRELLKGPLRYTDLAGHLPGIGTNILAARLRDLESAGVITRRQLPPPTPVRIYELTEHGRGLQSVVAELARWGARSLGPPEPDHLTPGWIRNPLEIFLPAGFRGRIEFRVGSEVASIVDGSVLDGPCEQPNLVVETDSDGFYHLLVEGEAAHLTVEGDETLLARFLERASAQPAPA